MSRRKRLPSESSEQTTFAEVHSEPPLDAESDPYICRFHDTEDSDLGKAYLHAGLLLVMTLLWSADFH